MVQLFHHCKMYFRMNYNDLFLGKKYLLRTYSIHNMLDIMKFDKAINK